MNIIEQARDVTEYLRSNQEDDARDAADPMGIDFAQAVVRAANLADSLQARGDAPGEYSPAEQSAYRVAAHELRAALEGSEK